MAFLFVILFGIVLAQQHNHHTGISEDVYHHHSETLTKKEIEILVEAIEKHERLDAQNQLILQRDLENQNDWRKLKRIFFKNRKELHSPDIWEPMRREQN